jgi:MFS family permease
VGRDRRPERLARHRRDGPGIVRGGLLGAALGLGGIIGSSAAASLVGRPRIAPAFVVGVVVFGVPLIGIGVAPQPLVAVALLVGAGAGRSAMDAAGRLLLQRGTPNDVLARIFGILEESFQGAFGLGSLLVSWLIASRGPEFALVVAGLWLPAVVVVASRSIWRIDRSATVPAERLSLLRAIPMFASLSPATAEWLARNLVPVWVDAGGWIIREGDVGDRFYIVDEGEVGFFVGGRRVGRESCGSCFGEIALLRDIPRTASVLALTDVSLFALDRGPFIEAVTGHPASRRAAERLVEERLAAS